jgi:hypothetical protein
MPIRVYERGHERGEQDIGRFSRFYRHADAHVYAVRVFSKIKTQDGATKLVVANKLAHVGGRIRGAGQMQAQRPTLGSKQCRTSGGQAKKQKGSALHNVFGHRVIELAFSLTPQVT